jgi:hypothetical protein
MALAAAALVAGPRVTDALGDYPTHDKAGALGSVITLFGNCDIGGYANAAREGAIQEAEICALFLAEGVAVRDVAINVNCSGPALEIGHLIGGERPPWNNQSFGGGSIWRDARFRDNEARSSRWLAGPREPCSEWKFAKVHLSPMQDAIRGRLAGIFDYHSATWADAGMSDFRSSWLIARDHLPSERMW